MIKLYPKKLKSLDELRQEKAFKKAQAQAAVPNTSDGAGKSADTIQDIIDTGIDFISSKGVLNKVIALALPALTLAGRKLEKDILKSFAKEFVAGYAKWKAIELGAKALFSFLKKSEKTD